MALCLIVLSAHMTCVLLGTDMAHKKGHHLPLCSPSTSKYKSD